MTGDAHSSKIIEKIEEKTETTIQQIKDEMKEALDKINQETEEKIKAIRNKIISEAKKQAEVEFMREKTKHELDFKLKLTKYRDQLVDHFIDMAKEELLKITKTPRYAESIQKMIEATKQNIQTLKESASITLEQTLSQKRLAAIQQMLAFTSQVVSLQQTAMQLAMMGADNAANMFMDTSIALTEALEDGTITEQEMKDILEKLGVTFDETGKPVINLKNIMEEFRKKMEETRNKVQDFRSTLTSLDGLTVHTYHYHHEITVHEEKGRCRP